MRTRTMESLEAHGFVHEVYEDITDGEGDELHLWVRNGNHRKVFGMWPGYGDTQPYSMDLPPEFLLNLRKLH